MFLQNFSPLLQSRHRSIAGANKGFSLVEVTLAMGVLSIALLTMIGLLPVGLDTARMAMSQTVKAQIVQRITSEAALTAFANLDDYVASGSVASPFYFDQEGQLATTENTHRYKVALAKLPVNSAFPGSTNASSLSDSLYAIQAVISDARSENSAEESSTHVIYVPNSGG
ncbi:MAG: Verru_Chthon cassette protein B [Chthoniobacterales bacterium]